VGAVVNPAPKIPEFVREVFQAWNSAKVPFLVLRNYEKLPEETGNDIDVLVEAKQMERAEQLLLAAARQCGFVLHNRAPFASLVLNLFQPETLAQIQFDLFSGLPWRGFATFDPRELLAARVDRGLFAVPHPAHEAISLLLGRLLQHGRVKEAYQPAIREKFQAYPNESRDMLARLFGATLAQKVIAGCIAERWDAVAGLTPALRRALVWRGLFFRPCSTMRRLAGDLLRLARRWQRPSGLSVALLGADGSGKSTVAGAFIELLRPTFPPGKGLEIHWKPVVFFRKRRKARGTPVIDPHGKPPRNPLASLMYFGGHWLEFVLGWGLQVRPALFHGGLVLIDRYYYDFLVDQRRFRLNLPAWVLRAGLALVPKPGLVFLLDAPADVLQARKQEVSAVEAARQVKAYREVVAKLPNGRILEATQPVAQVAADMARHTLEFMAARERLKRRSAERRAC
jgi:thymidylate kinase